MDSIRIEAADKGYYLLFGALTFATVPQIVDDGDKMFDVSVPALTFDLQGVKHIDSAGLSLLVEWMRKARHHNKEIAFQNVPPQMLAIAKASELDEILPLS